MNPFGLVLVYMPPLEMAIALAAGCFLAGTLIAAVQIAMGRA